MSNVGIDSAWKLSACCIVKNLQPTKVHKHPISNTNVTAAYYGNTNMPILVQVVLLLLQATRKDRGICRLIIVLAIWRQFLLSTLKYWIAKSWKAILLSICVFKGLSVKLSSEIIQPFVQIYFFVQKQRLVYCLAFSIVDDGGGVAVFSMLT